MKNEMNDHGADPIGDGTFRMVPSGDIVTLEERNRRLSGLQPRNKTNDCFGLSWEDIAIRQGGLSTLDITRKRHWECGCGSGKVMEKCCGYE